MTSKQHLLTTMICSKELVMDRERRIGLASEQTDKQKNKLDKLTYRKILVVTGIETVV